MPPMSYSWLLIMTGGIPYFDPSCHLTNMRNKAADKDRDQDWLTSPFTFREGVLALQLMVQEQITETTHACRLLHYLSLECLQCAVNHIGEWIKLYRYAVRIELSILL